jgi:hypothetical protein
LNRWRICCLRRREHLVLEINRRKLPICLPRFPAFRHPAGVLFANGIDLHRLDRALAAAIVLAALYEAHADSSKSPPLPDVRWSQISEQAGGGKGAVQLASGEILATRMQRGSNSVQVICARSTDGGRQWQDLSTVAKEQTAGADVGDGHLLQLHNGEVRYSFRNNFTRTNAAGWRQYSIRTRASRDSGKTWGAHFIVAQSMHRPEDGPDALRGLWSSFLLQKRDGTLQCYYDDEDTPHRAGFFRNQWLTMKTWDEEAQEWGNPVTVSRAHDPKHLSREGMPSVVELPDGQLLCVFESVQTIPPHANCIRAVTSDDGGRTWSWQRVERQMVYETSRPNHLAVSPWIARLPDGPLVCVFTTDEDRDTPSAPGTPPWAFRMDLKWIFSGDNGRSWSRPAQTVFANQRSYAPGVLVLSDGNLLVTTMSFDAAGHRAFRGAVAR